MASVSNDLSLTKVWNAIPHTTTQLVATFAAAFFSWAIAQRYPAYYLDASSSLTGIVHTFVWIGGITLVANLVLEMAKLTWPMTSPQLEKEKTEALDLDRLQKAYHQSQHQLNTDRDALNKKRTEHLTLLNRVTNDPEGLSKQKTDLVEELNKCDAAIAGLKAMRETHLAIGQVVDKALKIIRLRGQIQETNNLLRDLTDTAVKENECDRKIEENRGMQQECKKTLDTLNSELDRARNQLLTAENQAREELNLEQTSQGTADGVVTLLNESIKQLTSERQKVVEEKARVAEEPENLRGAARGQRQNLQQLSSRFLGIQKAHGQICVELEKQHKALLTLTSFIEDVERRLETFFLKLTDQQARGVKRHIHDQFDRPQPRVRLQNIHAQLKELLPQNTEGPGWIERGKNWVFGDQKPESLTESEKDQIRKRWLNEGYDILKKVVGIVRGEYMQALVKESRVLEDEQRQAALGTNRRLPQSEQELADFLKTAPRRSIEDAFKALGKEKELLERNIQGHRESILKGEQAIQAAVQEAERLDAQKKALGDRVEKMLQQKKTLEESQGLLDEANKRKIECEKDIENLQIRIDEWGRQKALLNAKQQRIKSKDNNQTHVALVNIGDTLTEYCNAFQKAQEACAKLETHMQEFREKSVDQTHREALSKLIAQFRIIQGGENHTYQIPPEGANLDKLTLISGNEADAIKRALSQISSIEDPIEDPMKERIRVEEESHEKKKGEISGLDKKIGDEFSDAIQKISSLEEELGKKPEASLTTSCEKTKSEYAQGCQKNFKARIERKINDMRIALLLREQTKLAAEKEYYQAKGLTYPSEDVIRRKKQLQDQAKADYVSFKEHTLAEILGLYEMLINLSKDQSAVTNDERDRFFRLRMEYFVEQEIAALEKDCEDKHKQFKAIQQRKEYLQLQLALKQANPEKQDKLKRDIEELTREEKNRAEALKKVIFSINAARFKKIKLGCRCPPYDQNETLGKLRPKEGREDLHHFSFLAALCDLESALDLELGLLNQGFQEEFKRFYDMRRTPAPQQRATLLPAALSAQGRTGEAADWTSLQENQARLEDQTSNAYKLISEIVERAFNSAQTPSPSFTRWAQNLCENKAIKEWPDRLGEEDKKRAAIASLERIQKKAAWIDARTPKDEAKHSERIDARTPKDEAKKQSERINALFVDHGNMGIIDGEIKRLQEELAALGYETPKTNDLHQPYTLKTVMIVSSLASLVILCRTDSQVISLSWTNRVVCWLMSATMQLQAYMWTH